MGGDNTLDSTLYIFSSFNNNPYQIRNIYISKNNPESNAKSANTTSPTLTSESSSLLSPHIDYLIFLDSDDYWDKNLLSECLKVANGVDIVWFDNDYYFDGIKPFVGIRWLKFYNLTQECIITPTQWLAIHKRTKLHWFAWVWQGFIDFSFLIKNEIRFIDDIIHEEHYFGILSLILASQIYILPKALYIYRQRPHSITKESSAKTIGKLSPHMQNIYDRFHTIPIKSKKYHYAAGFSISAIQLAKNIAHIDFALKCEVAQMFMPMFCENVPIYLESKYDPFDIIPQLAILKPYAKYATTRAQFAIAYPYLYKKLVFIVRCLRWLRKIGRTLKS